MEEWKLHVLCWSHLDREWEFPFEIKRAIAAGIIETVCEMLEEGRLAAFHLDGQSSPLEDYLELHPEREERVRSLVKAGKLLVGPWYTLPEMNVVLGECIVRNLTTGIRIAERLGGAMMEGFTNSGWGQISQMPQILSGVGIHTYTSYRGVPVHLIEKECLWEGPDGSRVVLFRPSKGGRAVFFLKISLPATTALEGSCKETPACSRLADEAHPVAEPYFGEHDPRRIRTGHVRRALEGILETMKDDATTSHLWLGDWQDGRIPHPETKRILEECRKHLPPGCSIFIDTIPSYIQSVLAERKDSLKVQVRGELRWPRRDEHAAELLNVLSARTHLKVMNRKVEHLLVYGTEPWVTVASVLGMEYPDALMERAWKLLLRNHAHDTVGGVGIDRVHEDQENRYRRVIDICTHLRRKALSFIAARRKLPPGSIAGLFVFNPLPFSRREVVEAYVDTPVDCGKGKIELVTPDGKVIPVHQTKGAPTKNKIYMPYDSYQLVDFVRRRVQALVTLPPCGVLTLGVRSTAEEPPAHRSMLRTGENWMENEFVKVSFHKDGSFSIKDKKSGLTMEPCGIFEDEGDEGSGWGFGAPKHDVKADSTKREAVIRLDEHTPFEVRFLVKTRMTVPRKVDRKNSRRAGGRVSIDIEAEYTLKEASPVLHCRVRVTNRAEDHRLRVLFSVPRDVTTARAEMPFDVVSRPIEPMDTDGWLEHDDGTRPMQHFVDASGRRGGLAFLSNGLCEYEVFKRGRKRFLAVTLLRAYAYRLVRWINTPDASVTGSQCPGTHSYEWGLYVHGGDHEKAGVIEQAYALGVPPAVVQSFHPGADAAAETSFVRIDGKAVLSALKRAENGDGLVLRFWNPSGRKKTFRIFLSEEIPVKEVYRCDLREHPLERLERAKDGSFPVECRRRGIETLLITTR